MLHMMRSMFDLLREGVFYNRQIMFRQRTTRRVLLPQHRGLNDAFQSRNANPARPRAAAPPVLDKQRPPAQQTPDRNETPAQPRNQPTPHPSRTPPQRASCVQQKAPDAAHRRLFSVRLK